MKLAHIVIVMFLMSIVRIPIVATERFPDGADLFIEAVRYRWDNHTLVHSMSYVAEQTYRVSSLSVEEIEKKADDIEKQLREATKHWPNAHLWIDGTREAMCEQLQNSVLSRFSVKYSAPSFSRKLLSLHIERLEEDSQKWEMETNVIEASVVGEKSTSEGAIFFPQSRSADINDIGSYMEALLNFGRLKGPSALFALAIFLQDTNIEKYEFSEKNIAKFKEEREKQIQAGQAKTLQTVGTVMYDDDANAYIVESSINGKVIERYWIDVARGYVCPLIQYYDVNSKLLAEYKSREYFLHGKSGLWFPQVYEEMTADRDGKQEFKEYRINKTSVDINFPVTDDEFAIEIPDGTTVIDARQGKGSRRYVAVNNGVLSLGKGGLDLEKQKWLLLTDLSPNLQRFIFVRVFFVGIGTLLIMLGFYFKFCRKS